jgi:hypothetical protein
VVRQRIEPGDEVVVVARLQGGPAAASGYREVSRAVCLVADGARVEVWSASPGQRLVGGPKVWLRGVVAAAAVLAILVATGFLANRIAKRTSPGATVVLASYASATPLNRRYALHRLAHAYEQMEWTPSNLAAMAQALIARDNCQEAVWYLVERGALSLALAIARGCADSRRDPVVVWAHLLAGDLRSAAGVVGADDRQLPLAFELAVMIGDWERAEVVRAKLGFKGFKTRPNFECAGVLLARARTGSAVGSCGELDSWRSDARGPSRLMYRGGKPLAHVLAADLGLAELGWGDTGQLKAAAASAQVGAALLGHGRPPRGLFESWGLVEATATDRKVSGVTALRTAHQLVGNVLEGGRPASLDPGELRASVSSLIGGSLAVGQVNLWPDELADVARQRSACARASADSPPKRSGPKTNQDGTGNFDYATEYSLYQACTGDAEGALIDIESEPEFALERLAGIAPGLERKVRRRLAARIQVPIAPHLPADLASSPTLSVGGAYLTALRMTLLYRYLGAGVREVVWTARARRLRTLMTSQPAESLVLLGLLAR